MGRARTIARRTFLVGSAAILGGVAFGTYMVRRPHANPLEQGLADGAATFNPWVLIDAKGITLVTPHADTGQGAASMQAMLIAEEMDLQPGQFDVTFGQPAAAYWNTAMAGEAAPFRSDDHGLMARTTRQGISYLMKVMGMQVTGGSSATADSFDKLRAAGASARETLKAAAAAEHGVSAADLTTRAGAVILPDGTEVPYTALAARAAALDPVTDVSLRDPSEWRLVGKPHRRLDIVAKSTGTLTYGIDLSLPDMIHATVRLSPRRSALASYDATEAEAMRGVLDIVPVRNGLAVLADNTWRAFRAAEAIACEWAPAAFPAEQADHWAAVAAAFDTEPDSTLRDFGSVTDALSGADVVEAEYRAPYLAHQPMEPLSVIAKVTDDSAEIWTSHQFPRFLQTQVAKVLGLDADRITLHNQFAGGSFGHRLEFEHVERAAEIAATRPGVPVKLTYRREEDFAQDFPRQIAMARARGTVRDGRVHALDIAVAMPSVTRSQMGRIGVSLPGADTQIPAGIWNAPYGIANFRVRGYAVPGLAPTSSWRSVGASTAGFFFESFVDELIHAAGADPLEERLRLVSDPRARAVLEAVGEMSDWAAPPPGRARGLAMIESFGVPVAEVVEVEQTDRGLRLTNVWVAAEVGRVVDPVNFENIVQGGVIWGLGHAMDCELTYTDGRPDQSNFDTHAGMRFAQCPPIHVRAVELSPQVHGIGEPPVPPAAPALANAIFALTGTRPREMPFSRTVDFA